MRNSAAYNREYSRRRYRRLKEARLHLNPVCPLCDQPIPREEYRQHENAHRPEYPEIFEWLDKFMPQTEESTNEESMTQEAARVEAGDRDMRASAMKAHRIIQKARAKMTPEARAVADEKARAILAEARRKARKLRS